MKHAIDNFKDKPVFIDIDTRNSFRTKRLTPSVIKCASRHNHYGVQNKMINE